MKSREEWKVYENVFSQASLYKLHKLSGQGYFTELESPISTGKEANIFSAKKEDGSRIIIKIYRLENCNFNKMYEYIRADPRYITVRRGKRQIVFAWVQREYRNLLKAREAIPVPTPIAYKDNILLMQFIGHEDPAPQLNRQKPKDPQAFFDTLIHHVQRLYKAGLIHGDLSPYNILNHDEQPVFIDFSQATMATAPNADELLRRDVHNICTYFSRLITVDEDKVYHSIRL